MGVCCVTYACFQEWSSNGKTTIATKDPMLQGVLGDWKRTEGQGLSHWDKLLANTMYDCLSKASR